MKPRATAPRGACALFGASVLAGCAVTTPSVKAPVIPPADQEALAAATAVNAECPGSLTWRALPAEVAFDLTIERYRLGDALTMVLVREPRAIAFTFQTWFFLSASSPPALVPDPRLLAFLEGARSHPGSPSMRALEDQGAIVGAGAFLDFGYFRVTLPGRADAARLEAVARIEAERLSGVPAPLATGLPRPVPGGGKPAAEPAAGDFPAQRRRLEQALEVLLASGAGPTGPSTGQSTARPEGPRSALQARGGPAGELVSPLTGKVRGPPESSARPGLVLSVSGDVDRRTLLRVVLRAYGPALAGPQPRTAPLEAGRAAAIPPPRSNPSSGSGDKEALGAGQDPTAGRRAADVEWAAHAQALLIAWPVPGAGAPEHLRLEVLAEILAGGPGSRLGRALVPGLAAAVEAEVPATAGEGVLRLFIALQPGRTASTAVAAVERELAGVAGGSLGPAEVAAAGVAIHDDLLRDLARLEERGQVLGRATLFGAPPVTATLAALEGLSAAELGTVAARYLGKATRLEVLGHTRTAKRPPPRKPRPVPRPAPPGRRPHG